MNSMERIALPGLIPNWSRSDTQPAPNALSYEAVPFDGTVFDKGVEAAKNTPTTAALSLDD